ncbi:hypothetical protein GD627_10795 [Arthrobacter yangruifuii]|uniref:DUF4440 domain-containing protein n=1 Tax=Arthrobacter yangruifuii TaxID=2606616 RepID=A0A5N6MHT5_9MICC|nr:hypothetical protein [Arthrobacter yangruifuii]KAD3633294.1 hypothetical protein GD627_10795 [Arthrobacter yangruifuii]
MSDDIPSELAREALVRLEQRLALDGAPAYEELLHEDALVVVPGAVLNKGECVAAIAASAGWDRIDIAPFWYFGTADTASIAYRFTGNRGPDEYQAVMLSAYLLEAGRPRLIHHQQTPEAS